MEKKTKQETVYVLINKDNELWKLVELYSKLMGIPIEVEFAEIQEKTITRIIEHVK